MTEVENRIKMCLQERIDNVVNEVLSQAMLHDSGSNAEELGAFDKDWIKKIIVVDATLADKGSVCADELAEELRCKMIDACLGLCDGDFAIVDIGWEWAVYKSTLRAIYILSVDRDALKEWNKLTDNKLFNNIASFVAEQEKDYDLKSIAIRSTEFEINVSI